MSNNPEIKLIATSSDLRECLSELEHQTTKPPSLYMDVEGINLGRNGSTSVVSIYALPQNKVYIIDVHVLGQEAFITTNGTGTSLKNILESNTPIVVFDIRNDSDALFSHFGVSVDGIIDIQLMELAQNNAATKYLPSLAYCVERDSDWSTERKLSFARMKAGYQYDKFNERPLTNSTIQYCVQDVTALSYLWSVYHRKLDWPGMTMWRCLVKNTTKERIAESQSPSYNPNGRDRACSPWDTDFIEEYTERWNDDVFTLNRDGMVFDDEKLEWFVDDREGVYHWNDWGDWDDHIGFDDDQCDLEGYDPSDWIGYEDDKIQNGEI